MCFKLQNVVIDAELVNYWKYKEYKDQPVNTKLETVNNSVKTLIMQLSHKEIRLCVFTGVVSSNIFNRNILSIHTIFQYQRKREILYNWFWWGHTSDIKAD